MKEIIVNVDNYNENSIKTIEGDNLSEVYKIYICKNKRRVNLTNKIAVMAYVNEYGSKKSNILALNITNATEGEIELPITNVISNENGVYACQIAIYGENNSLEQTAPFSLIVENNIFSKISNTAINSTDFHILSEAIKTANEYSEKLKEGTEKIELQYANKLNGVDKKSDNIAKQKVLNSNAGNPICTPTPDESGQVVHPKVLYFPNGWGAERYEYWMAITPYKNTDDAYENPCILVSRTGNKFFVPIGGNNPIDKPSDEDITNGAHMSDTHIVMVGNTMELWYRYNPPLGGGRPDNSQNFIFRKKSNDGIHWSERETIFSGSNQRLSPAIIFEDGKYKVWYVNQREIYYTESSDCINWSEDVKCNYDFGEWKPWHLDVIKTDLGYEMVVCCTNPNKKNNDIMWEFHAISLNCLDWNEEKLIMKPSVGKYNWDNMSIYRGSLLKIDGLYKFYYSANGYDGKNPGKWFLGLSEGYDIEYLVGVNDMTSYEELDFLENISIKDGKTFITGLISYLKNNKLKLGRKGIASVLLACDEVDNLLKVKTGNGLELGDLQVRNFICNLIESFSSFKATEKGVKSAFLTPNGIEFSDNPTKYKENLISLVNKGVAGVKLKADDKQDTLKIMTDGNDKQGFMECSGIYLNSNNQIQEFEGAVRYNSQEKKHQGYDGTTWHDLY